MDLNKETLNIINEKYQNDRNTVIKQYFYYFDIRSISFINNRVKGFSKEKIQSS